MSKTSLQDLITSRYEAEGVLGRGGMGVVIKAHDVKLKRPVAIKCLSDELFQMEEAVEIFLAEASALAELSHPHLVQVYDIIEADDGVAMVQEFVDGKTLEQELKERGTLPQEEVTSILAQIASVTGYLHSVSFIHRDFKPANILIDDTGFIRLIDFGLARRLDTLNARGTRVRGTPAYMAPEQVRNRPLSPATDIYQIGISMFELLTGRLPFEESGDIFALTHAHVTETPPRIDALDANLDPELSQLIDDCLIKDPDERVSNCRELVGRLEPIHNSLTGLTLEEAGLLHNFDEVGQGQASRRVTTGPFNSLRHDSEPNVRARSTGEQPPFTTQNDGLKQETISQENLTELELRLAKLEEENTHKQRRTVLLAVAAVLLVAGIAAAVVVPSMLGTTTAAAVATSNDTTLADTPAPTPSDDTLAAEPVAAPIAKPIAEPAAAPAVEPVAEPTPSDDASAAEPAVSPAATTAARNEAPPTRKAATKRASKAAPKAASSPAEVAAPPAKVKTTKKASGLDSFQVIDKNDDDIDSELKNLSDDGF